MPAAPRVVLRLAVIAGAILVGESLAQAAPGAANPPQHAAASPTALWAGLLERTPVPHDLPLPGDNPTILDGAYALRDPSPPQWWSCLRCADYRPTGGPWRLLFDRGVLRIIDVVTGWKNLASFEVDGDTLHLFNDPICPLDRGSYRWQADKAGVTFEVIEDACSFGLRAQNLTRAPWSSCRAPDVRAAVSGVWVRPAGCATEAAELAPSPVPPAGWSVSVYPNDARGSQTPPDVVVGANPGNTDPPPGVVIAYDDGAVPYGMNLILWQGGSWAEATSERPLAAIGVQFWGPSTMGVGRILFDGKEIWRGNASELGSSLGQYGGYVEVSGFGPGRHALRVEHLDPDGRPLKVLFFGLR